MIRYHSDALTARTENTIFAAEDLWTSRTWNEAFQTTAKDSADFLNWGASDNEFDIYTPSCSWFREMFPIGSSVMSLTWTDRQRIQFVPGEGGRPRPVQYTVGRGPCFTALAREDILWQSDRPLAESEYVITKTLQTRSDLARLEQFGGIDKGYLDKLKPCREDYASNTRQAKRHMDGLGADPFDLYDIRQAWVEWPVLRGLRFERLGSFDWATPIVPMLVTFDYTTGTVLRAQGKPFYTSGWPFYEGQFRSTPGRKNPAGLSKMLEHMQRAATIILNQAIDTNTLNNSLNYATTDPKIQTRRFVPGRPILVDNIADFVHLPVNKVTAPDMALMNAVFAIGERLTGINDPGLGREIRMGGHPSPATSTAMMLQESKEMLRATLRQLRLEYSRMAEDLLTMYQQFEAGDSGKIERAIGALDAASATRGWQIPRGPVRQAMSFDIKAMDEHANPETAMQKTMAVMQMTANYWGQIVQFMMLSSNPQTPPDVKAIIPQFISAYTEAAKHVLESGMVDEVEKYVMQMQENQFGAQNAIAKLGALAGDQLGGMESARNGRPLQPIPQGTNGLPMGPTGAPPIVG